MISFFMNIRNTLSLGYPFVESILSALPACEQFVVSDGYSDDGTYEILQQLANSNPKIELVRVKWDYEKNKGTSILAETANQTKKYCKGSHVFYLQANEIIHEKSVEAIKMLPDQHPAASLFHIPYYLLAGRNFLYSEEYRLRLAKNDSEINALSDGTHLCYSKRESALKLISALGSPRGVENGLKNIIAPYAFDQRVFIHTILPKPVFRYNSIYRENYVKKLENTAKIIPEEAKKLDDFVKNTNEENYSEYLARQYNEGEVPFNSNLNSKPYPLELKEHPKIMQPLLRASTMSYSVRPQLLKPNR